MNNERIKSDGAPAIFGIEAADGEDSFQCRRFGLVLIRAKDAPTFKVYPELMESGAVNPMALRARNRRGFVRFGSCFRVYGMLELFFTVIAPISPDIHFVTSFLFNLLRKPLGINPR